MSKDNHKLNRMVGTKWAYHIELLRVSTLFFLKILFQFKNLLKRVDLMYQRLKYPYSYFLQVLEFYLTVLFPYEYP